MALRKVADGEQKSLRQLAQEKWRSSGLSEAVAKRLRLRPLTGQQTAALGPNFHPAASLQIPYFDLRGRPTQFFRVRYLEPLPGFAGQLQKPDRFTQEIRALNEVYLPPLFKDTWEAMSGNKDLALYITEGELKAAAGCAAGLPTLGVGGVDVWRASKRGITFLPALAKFTWKERQVRIVYDSDLATKPDVIRAQRSLAQELLARGALVQIVNLPPAKELDDKGLPKKNGLDDFLVREGADALEALLEDAVPFPESDALWGLNEEVLIIPKMSVIVERRTGDLIDADRFKRITYANRHYMETLVKKKQVSLVKKPLAPRWIEWEHRAEMERICYEPGMPKEYNGMWNVWPGWGCDPKKGDVGPWHWLMEFFFKDDVKIRRWFERWLAYPLQHPGVKMYAACLFWSRAQRIGKTMVAYAMKGIYGKNFVEIKSKDLKGTFNTWAKNRQFVYGDEIKGNDAKVDADWFKGLVTEEEVAIEAKFIDKYTMRDTMNWYCSSNHPDALFLEDKDERWLIHEILQSKPAAREQYEMMDKWLHGAGPAALFRYLLDLNLGTFNPREHAPATLGKFSMISLGKNDAAFWVQLLREDPAQALRSLGEGVGATCDLYTPTHLHRAFDPEGRSRSNVAALGRALAQAGYHQITKAVPVRTATGLQRLYAIRDQEHWEKASNKELREHFDRFWAPGERKMT